MAIPRCPKGPDYQVGSSKLTCVKYVFVFMHTTQFTDPECGTQTPWDFGRTAVTNVAACCKVAQHTDGEAVMFQCLIKV